MSNAVVMTGFGGPEVLRWSPVATPEPGPGQIRIKVAAAGISPTDLPLRSGLLKAFALPAVPVLGFEVAGTVDALGPGTTGVAVGDEVAAFLLELGGYAEHVVASIWTPKPASVSWADAAALPSSAEAAVRTLNELAVPAGGTLLVFGGGGAVGVVATQLAVARGIKVLSVVGAHDEALVLELGATPVRYGPGVTARVRELGDVDAVLDAAGKGVLADAVELTGDPGRVVTLSDPAAGDFGVRLSGPDAAKAPAALGEVMTLLAKGKLRLRAHRELPMADAAEAHRLLEAGGVRERLVLMAG
ncbi:NADP-dependent oxidoreductase [Amycolatopsis sp. NBC_01307]|uniref:NADP-dependent oxidoreductase n=1 Tax=Amycolatopsis sp. NBC_01307 TaxID=2903561 RepID=UPI002E114CDB|nr:NADP-dependent oxidoreductase [Amycolatopsis sp. NBC_01307]